MTSRTDRVAFGLSCLVVAGVVSGSALGQTPTAAKPYVLSVFAKAPAGLSAPDSLAVTGHHVFVGYGDGHKPDGSDGLSSQVVEYADDGTVLHTYTVPGHSDGLKVDPVTRKLWALQNEDANPNLVVIDPATHHQKFYRFGTPAHGGGYDDMTFIGCKAYISASNPAHNPNDHPAIVSATLDHGFVEVAPILSGTAAAIDIPTDATVQLNLQDPDSMTADLLGDLVLDSQGDQELIVVSHPGKTNQRVLRLPLGYETTGGRVAVEVDDTVFTTSTKGYLLIADKGLNAVYKLEKSAFAPGAAYTAADGGPFVGTVDLSTGIISPIVTGLSNPGGLAFVETAAQQHEDALKDSENDKGCERD